MSKKELVIKPRPLSTKETVKFIKEELSDEFVERVILPEINFNNIYFDYIFAQIKEYYESMLPDVRVYTIISDTYGNNHAIQFRYKNNEIEQSELDRMIGLRAFL